MSIPFYNHFGRKENTQTVAPSLRTEINKLKDENTALNEKVDALTLHLSTQESAAITIINRKKDENSQLKAKLEEVQSSATVFKLGLIVAGYVATISTVAMGILFSRS
ncbi:MAG: hypothetical protein S4CHLAM37_02940 [Chlamydiia bacterium]|nr:hypothetical protein [Chlamydiia bacterium]